jgi:hypothetical protein
MAETPLPIRRISAQEMREKFNNGLYFEQTKSGQLTAVLMKDRHPSLPAANEPFCTRSQMVSYRNGPMEVARVHQYLRPDGTIGASGLPDPKELYENGILYRVAPK